MCVFVTRVLLQEGIYDACARQFAWVVQERSIGAGVTEGIAIGPLIDARALEKVDRIVLDAIRQGARVLAGGHRHPMGGNFYTPTVLGDVTPSMACMTAEIF